MNPRLVIFSTNAELIARLKSQCTQLPYVDYAVGDGPAVAKAEHLDALKVSQMDAVERYGFNPPHPLLEARVLKTPAPLIERGLPRYAISGVALPKDFPRDPRSELELVISSTLIAVKEFNARGEDQILRVGILPETLGFLDFPAAEIFQTLDRIYGELVPNP
jgi:hypothetical protein